MKLALIAIACVGCVEHVPLGHDGGTEAGIDGLVAIEIAPAEPTLAVVLGAPAKAIAFTATGRFGDGSMRDVTSEISWSADGSPLGAFGMPAGSFATTNAAGGHVAIAAASGALVGVTTLTIVASAQLVDSEFPPPDGAGILFDGTPAADPMRSPAILYPSDQTMFPQELAPVVIQYGHGMANDVVRIAFDSDVLHVSLLTGAPDRWLPDISIWKAIELSGVAAPIALSIEAASSTAMSGTPYGGSTATLRFSRAPAPGVIDYFSGATKGIMQTTLASVSATRLYPPIGDNTCAGCHTVSRSGRAIAFGYGGGTLQTIDAASLATVIPATAKIPMGWATYSPAGDRLLVADGGTVTLYDAASGASLGVVPLAGPATHPDWSPDGTRVAIVLASSVDPMNMDVKGGRIVLLPYQGGSWGVPQILVSSTGDNDNNFFPKWSPDGSTIAYVHASSGSKSAASAELRIVPAAGGVFTPLTVASHRVAFTDGVANLADTMPAWAPQQSDVAWLAFASTRSYGVVRPMPSGPSQIWIAAVDLARAGDPSFAAFWLPSQVITTVGNNPIWAPAASTTE